MTPYSQDLRKNMTDAERKLWYEFLCDLPVRFHRQKPIGKYIVDFYCAKANIAIELDGSQHYEEIGKASDEARDADLNRLGVTVLRYSDKDVMHNFKGVCEDILQRLNLSV